jgi:hypothetical protein
VGKVLQFPKYKYIAAEVWGNNIRLDLAGNVSKCRKYLREQFSKGSEFGWSLDLTNFPYKWHGSEREISTLHNSQGPSPFSLFFRLFNQATRLHSLTYIHRSNQVTYRILTGYKIVPYDISYILKHFQPNRKNISYTLPNFHPNRTEAYLPMLRV